MYGKFCLRTKKMIPVCFTKKCISWKVHSKTLVPKFLLLKEICVWMPATSVMGKSELDYYHQNVNGRVASQAAEQVKTSDIRKLGNFKKKPAIQKLRKNCCKAF